MLSSVQVHEIKNEVVTSRRKRGLKPEALAGKVGVGARFIRNLEQEKARKWGMKDLLCLLKVLEYLKLQAQVDAIQSIISNAETSSKRVVKRFKFDQRKGGEVPRRH